MFAWFFNLFGTTASHVEAAVKDLEAAKARLETAIVKETTHLTNIQATKETVISKSNEVQRVLREEYEALVAAETAKFQATFGKLDDQHVEKTVAVSKGEEILEKLKTVI